MKDKERQGFGIESVNFFSEVFEYSLVQFELSFMITVLFIIQSIS